MFCPNRIRIILQPLDAMQSELLTATSNEQESSQSNKRYKHFYLTTRECIYCWTFGLTNKITSQTFHVQNRSGRKINKNKTSGVVRTVLIFTRKCGQDEDRRFGVRFRAPPSPPPLAPISFHARTYYA